MKTEDLRPAARGGKQLLEHCPPRDFSCHRHAGEAGKRRKEGRCPASRLYLTDDSRINSRTAPETASTSKRKEEREES